MPLYDVEGRGTVWAKDPVEAFTLAHGAPSGEVKTEQADARTWRLEANGRQYKVTVRDDAA